MEVAAAAMAAIATKLTSRMFRFLAFIRSRFLK
jgi:hypothetical protein